MVTCALGIIGPSLCPPELPLRGQWGGIYLGPHLANSDLPAPSPQGLVPSACCQALSVFLPEASDCFPEKPDPGAQTKAGAAGGETPFSPPLPLTPTSITALAGDAGYGFQDLAAIT